MKKTLTLLAAACLFAAGLFAQAPYQINYQGVARNVAGNALPNENITLRITIHNGSANGAVVYQETRKVKTNYFGLFTIAIGGSGAMATTGSLSGIDWSAGGDKFIQVEMQLKSSSGFTDMGASKLLSVPFAFHAGSASPTGAAGGSLTGTYPNPTLGNAVVHTNNIEDGAITAAKLDPGIIFGGGGAAGGDLNGTYPNPLINPGAITTPKIADGAITAAKLANNSVVTSKIADNSITTPKVADGSITGIKLAPGLIPASLPPNGAAGGDLSGTYPNPAIKAGAITTLKIADNSITTPKLADASVTLAKLAPGLIPATLPPSGPAGGALTGTYPNPGIGNNVINTNNIVDGSITAAKLDPSIVLGGGGGGSSPTGPAGGDLSGTYPNPNIASNSITNNKIANGAVITPKIADGAVNGNKLADLSVSTIKIADGSVTLAKLAPGLIPASLPPSGTAGGDLGGTYPNPVVLKIQGIAVTNTAPAAGQVLKFNGTAWSPAAEAGGGLTLPYVGNSSITGSLFSITNSGSGSAMEAINSGTTNNATGLEGKILAISPGDFAAGIKGTNLGTNNKGYGVWGTHAGSGAGVYGSSVYGNGISGFSQSGAAVFGTSTDGNAGYFDIPNSSSASDALLVSTSGTGSGLVAIANSWTGMQGITNDPYGIGVLAFNNGGGEALRAMTYSNTGAAIVGANGGTFPSIWGSSTGTGGTGILGQAYADAGSPGNALVGEILGSGSGNPAVFRVDGTNVARIDETGKGYFNGGTQTGGADVAEYFSVEGARLSYQPGDVLVISQQSDRTVVKSTEPYSMLVAGVYATRPGVLLTERNAEQDQLDDMVPMGVIGVIPTKVCLQGGAIKRGDLLVTSSIPGVAMKADPDKVKVGQVLGKALQDYDQPGTGLIKVLVSIR